MTTEEIIARQKKERQKCLEAIVSSKAAKKIIIAGAGTGKTFTFREVLKTASGGENIAMTFIRMLAADMFGAFGHLAEVKTFHAFCKKILHEQNGRVEMIPFLTKVIEEDASYLGEKLTNFDEKFRKLDEGSREIDFYLARGNYYEVVSFNDSVYRLLQVLRRQPQIVPNFNNILIDEYQDFNPLEVAFIDELEKKGNILIVGDDDQAVYDNRDASPAHLRSKFRSGNYQPFELPFCSRCPDVIVNATNAFITHAQNKGFLKDRIQKPYECFLELKGRDSERFPRIIVSQCKVGKTIAKYVDSVIRSIEAEDISESWKEGSEYPTVLIVGQKQYLAMIQDQLSEKNPQMNYKLTESMELNVIDGYEILLRNKESNLGWRVLLDFYYKNKEIKSIVAKTVTGTPIMNLLPKDFVVRQLNAIEHLEALQKEPLNDSAKIELKSILGEFFDHVHDHFSRGKEEKPPEPDRTKPSVLLTSFVGCKGLSAGHVIIVGANDGSIPKDPKHITDVEIAQFVVALTRTRKQCHIVSNKWLIAPMMKGIFQTAYKPSCFLNGIPRELIEDKGLLSTNEIKIQ